MKLPAETPFTFATLDELRRGRVVKRAWLYLQQGEEIINCTGCHQDREFSARHESNPESHGGDVPPLTN